MNETEYIEKHFPKMYKQLVETRKKGAKTSPYKPLGGTCIKTK